MESFVPSIVTQGRPFARVVRKDMPHDPEKTHEAEE